MLTDMKKLLVVLDDETAHLLSKEKNKSETIRQAIKYIKMDITIEKLEDLRKSYQVLTKAIIDMDEKIDYIAGKVQ